MFRLTNLFVSINESLAEWGFLVSCLPLQPAQLPEQHAEP